jgi:hypothetical protein
MRRKSWGLGIYTYESYGNGPDCKHYGHPPKNISPLKYYPDPEACSKEEIRRWKQAKARALKKGPTAVQVAKAFKNFKPTVPFSFIVAARRASKNR